MFSATMFGSRILDSARGACVGLRPIYGISMTETTPAVVVRGELNGLGVVRSLAGGGVPTVVVDTTFRRAAMWSRYCRTTLVDRLQGRPFVDSLLALQSRLGDRPVLIL